jgi:hypothetical protein
LAFLENFWQLFGNFLGDFWPCLNPVKVNFFGLFGKLLATFWQLFGGFLALFKPG